MEPALKQRLVGAAVLVALAVIFLPMLVQGPAPDSGAADVPLDMPDAFAGEFETRELPLVTPARAPEGGAVGMDGTPPPAAEVVPDDAAEAAIVEEAPAVPADARAGAASPADAAELATQPPEPTTQPAPSRGQEANGGMFPAATAGGNYAVSFGSYSSVASADAVVKMLRESQLPSFREAAVVDGKTWQRVRIGPYATRAEAEAARLRAAHVRDDVGARVVVLDAADEAPAARPATSAPKAPAAADTGFAVQLAAFSKASDATALRDRARAAGFSAFTEAVATDDGTLTRVRVGPVMTRAQAEQLRDQVRAKLGTDGVVRPHP